MCSLSGPYNTFCSRASLASGGLECSPMGEIEGGLSWVSWSWTLGQHPWSTWINVESVHIPILSCICSGTTWPSASNTALEQTGGLLRVRELFPYSNTPPHPFAGELLLGEVVQTLHGMFMIHLPLQGLLQWSIFKFDWTLKTKGRAVVSVAQLTHGCFGSGAGNNCLKFSPSLQGASS